MKYIILLAIIPLKTLAQITGGIKFESNLSWTQIKDKAKKENKYIFLDAFTTWCIPCRYMSKEIFPQSKVGDFFNKNFLNVAVQCNKTKFDNDTIKKWYKDAATLQKDYTIDVYPTYLFFNSDGSLIHFIKGGSKTGEDFLKKARRALLPGTQYVNLKRQYKSGKTDSLFLLTLISTAQQSGDNTAIPVYINKYLSTQKDLITAQNLKFIYEGTTKSTDIGFKVLRNQPGSVDTIMGKGKSVELIKQIAFDEVVLPLVRKNGKKTNYGGGMVIYSGDVIPNVNWVTVKEKLVVNFADLADDIIISSKPTYFQWENDWANFTKSVSEYLTANENMIDTRKLINYAQAIYFDCDNLKYVEIAKNWVAKVIEINKKENTYLEIYCHLLYKAGYKEAAIKLMDELLSSTEPPKNDLTEELNKMKRGERIW
jgi:thioredoxin-related protein